VDTWTSSRPWEAENSAIDTAWMNLNNYVEGMNPEKRASTI
jgi:hypothetical protein